MKYEVIFSKRAAREFWRQNRFVQLQLMLYFRLQLNGEHDPRCIGKPLEIGYNLWQYRIGQYRMLAEVTPKKVVILALRTRQF